MIPRGALSVLAGARRAPLADQLLAAGGQEEFDAIWAEDEGVADAALRELAERAAQAGRMDLVDWIADKVGGLDALLERAPRLLQILLDNGFGDLLEALAMRAPFGWARRKRDKERIPQWELDLVQALIAAGKTDALNDAIERGALTARFLVVARTREGLALMFEARHAHMVDCLASHGLRAAERSAAGETALLAAVRRCAADGAGVDAVALATRLAAASDFDDELSAEALSVGRRHPALVASLLDAGANPRAMLPGGAGLLRSVVESGHEPAAELLASAGADPFAPNRDGLTAFDAAVGAGNPSLASKLSASAESAACDRAQRAAKRRDETLGARQL